MIRWFAQLDEVLRGDAVRNGGLEAGPGRVSLRGLTVVAIVLNAVYGLSVGSFTAIRTGGEQWMQMIASAVKLPMLFGLTLLVTLPSLYVFSALIGARLRFGAVCRLLAAMVGVVAAVLASLAPIVVFFGISTTSYPFMKVLIVFFCGVAGLLGLAFLLKTLQALVISGAHIDSDYVTKPPEIIAESKPAESVESTTSGHADHASAESKPKDEHEKDRPTANGIREDEEIRLEVGAKSNSARAVFRVWVLLFAVVGMQMSWILRPFIGHPELPFAWFRARESNFFLDIVDAITTLLGG